MTVNDLLPGDILAYPPSPAILGFLGLAAGEQLLGIHPVYAHVGLWLGAYEISAYTDSGVTISPHYPYPCRVLRPPKIAPAALARAVAWSKDRAGRTPYSWQALAWLAIVRRLGWSRVRQWPDTALVCSSLVARFFQEAGLDLFPRRFPVEVVPADFAAVRCLQDVGAIG